MRRCWRRCRRGIAGQLKLLDDPGLIETVRSLTGMDDMSATIVAQNLTAHLLWEIAVRGSRGGPLEPLANQLNHDRTHVDSEQLRGMIGEAVEALARLEGARRAAPTALAQLPAVAAGFTGRDEELAVLAGLLDPAGPAGPVVVLAVAGLAGVGKTTLAVKAGHAARQRGWFAGGALFVDLHGYDEAPVEPSQALDALLRALGVPAEHIPPTVEERARLYRSVLAKISDPVLVIADNASTEAQLRPLLPGAGPHKVLITSRHTLAGLDARLVDLTVLGEEAGVELLDGALRAARPDDDRIGSNPEAAGRLAGMCGGLPLALQIVAAVLKADPALTATELADGLATESARLERLAYDDGSGPSAPSVAAAFQLSYSRLDDTSARVFRLLPVNPGPDLSTAAVAVLADLPVTEMRTMLAGLAREHLAEAAPGSAGRWRMHDLVRLCAQRLSDPNAEADGREQARDRLLGHYLDMADAADDHLLTLPGMARPGEFTGREAALAWLDAERASLVAAVTMAADTGRDQVALRLPLALAGYLDWRWRFDDWLTITAISLNTARRLGDRHSEGTALRNLGGALRGVHRSGEAITAFDDAVTIFRETGDRQGEATALNGLGSALSDVDRSGEAITKHKDAAAIFRETGDRNGQGWALDTLGNALQGVERFEEAITAHQDAAAIFRETGYRHGEGMALNNLGLALKGVERFEEAITAHRHAAAIFRETGDRHREGWALTNRGVALQEVWRFEEAVTAHQHAAAIFRETGERDGEAMALFGLGLAFRKAQRFEEAVTAHKDAAAIFRETGDHGRERLARDDLEAAKAAQCT
jgi:tetratricopeptide (TPR) repeat protein